MQETQVRPLGREDPPEEGMATHSTILAREIPWSEKLEGYTVHGIAKELDVIWWLNNSSRPLVASSLPRSGRAPPSAERE